MKKILFDANFKRDKIGQQLNFRLFNACNNISKEHSFLGFSEQKTDEKIPQNTIIKNINLLGLENLWQASVPAISALLNKNTPFYFPSGNVPGLLPSSSPVITLIRDILPLDVSQNENDLKIYKRNIQTDINRSDLVFVLSENTKKRLMQEFLFFSEPVVLPFASLIPDEYIDLPLARTNEKYFFVDVENVSPAGLNSLLKVFIYSQMKEQKATKLYLSGDLKIITKELLINLDVARKVNAIREYSNLTSEQRSVLLRGAIAAILPTKIDIMPFAHLDAMKCSCPVITDELPIIKEVCDDAAIYANINDSENFLRLLYKMEQDHDYRNSNILKGLVREKIFSWNHAAKVFIENIEKLYETE